MRVCQAMYCWSVYLWVCEAGDVRVNVKDDAVYGSRQSDTADQQDQEHGIWECGRKVSSLTGEITEIT